MKAIALGAVLAAMLAAQPAVSLEPARYDGRIEAKETGVLSAQLNGVVLQILFVGGETVEAGQPLIILDPFDAETALAAAQARRNAAQAVLEGAEQQAARAMTLSDRGVTSPARRDQVETNRAAAEAALAEAEAVLRQAQRDLERTVIRAPIAGRVSRPNVSVGGYVEAEAGPPLAIIVTMDPVLVAYDVPYAARLETLRRAGVTTVAELHGRISISIELPGGTAYGQSTRPSFSSAGVDPETGAVTVWAELANPDTLLRPGMAVTVLSTVDEAAE